MKKLLIFFIIILFSFNSWARDEVKEYKIIIKNHKFIPQNLLVEAGRKFVLIIENQDTSVEEFESQDLDREKIIKGGKTIKINIDSLKIGTYKYFGEFHSKTAKGIITVQ